MNPTIRDATLRDMPAITAIYNDAVLHTTAIWNETVVDVDNRLAWHAARTGLGYPVLVAEAEDGVIGYGTFGDFRAFDGYRHTVEHSVYVAEGARRRGVASALIVALAARAAALDKHVMIAGIAADNAGSIALHARLGFVETGRMPEVGRKFGRWLDLVLMQKML